MAIVHVGNITDFIAAISVADNEVIVDNDIDAQDWAASETTVRATKITGNDHSISNINHLANGNLFYFGANCTIDKLHLINFICFNTSDAATFHGRNYQATFNDCKFQGRFRNFAYRNINCNRCTFTFESGLKYAHWMESSSVTWDQCYIDFKVQTSNAFPVFAGTSDAVLNNCYFKGQLKASTTNGQFSFVLANCVVNTDLVGTVTTPISTQTTSRITLYNSDKIGNVTITAKNNVIPLTDAQLKDPAAVAATGFPLVTS